MLASNGERNPDNPFDCDGGGAGRSGSLRRSLVVAFESDSSANSEHTGSRSENIPTLDFGWSFAVKAHYASPISADSRLS
ncbi:unnamed protein product [Sphagnum balticum]